MSWQLLVAIVALVLACISIFHNWQSPWALALPVAVLLLAVIHVLGGGVVVP